MNTPESPIEQTPKPQITKEELELKKLALEIKDLERSFWKRPTYILAALPTLLAVVTLSVGLFNGYFSASLTKLENQKHDLQVEVTNFEAKRDELYSTNDRLKTEKKLLEARVREMQQSYESQVATLKAKRTELEKNNGSLSQKNDSLIQAIKEQESKTAKTLKEKEDLQARLPKEPIPTCLR